MTSRVGFVRWRSELASGGNRYDDELAARLPVAGVPVHEYAVTGPWPLPTADDVAQLAEQLRHEDAWLIGNIVASAVPGLIAESVADGRRVTVLMHYFPADDPTLTPRERERLQESERRMVAAASAIVVPSEWAASQVATRYGRRDAVVAPPGVEPAGVAPGSADGAPPKLLWLARLSEGKDPMTFVEALAHVRDLDWTASLVGPATDDTITGRVRTLIDSAGLGDRVALCGARVGPALDATWARTDLLVHTSRAETYGMVVAEALAHAIPSIVTARTGAVEAQHGVGASFAPGDTDALVAILRTWLTDPVMRGQWRRQAIEQRSLLAAWSDTARTVAAVLA